MKEMGLAVVQQLKGNSGFEHGMLASMFDDRAAGKVTVPRLRLVDVNKIEDFLNDPSHSEQIHVDFAALDELRNAALNIESHDDHTAKTTFNYGVKELVKGYGEHDENIASDIGTMKTSNATQSGYNQLKEKRRWETALQLALNNQREEYLRRLEAQMRELRERIKNIDNAMNTLDGKTNADFIGDSAEAQENRRKIDEDLAKLGKSREDFLNENGEFDVQRAQEYLRQNRQETQHKLDQQESEYKIATGKTTPEDAIQEKNDITELVNAKSEAKPVTKFTADAFITSSFNTSSTTNTSETNNAPQSDGEAPPVLASSANTSSSPADEMDAGFASIDQIDMMETVAQITNRPVGSVAGSLDEKSNSVLSSNFTALAKGEVQQTPSRSVDITPTTAPALRTLTA